jgi:xylan 1,4-beta-xylosidase
MKTRLRSRYYGSSHRGGALSAAPVHRRGGAAWSLGACVGLCVLLQGSVPPAFAQTATAATITVDGTATGTPLEPIWAYHGYDECNYTTTVEGKALLQTLGAIPPPPPHIRTHFLLNTGDGVASPKWGSTNAYTTDAAGNPVYDWTLLDGIMDTITAAGALPYVEIGFMPEALSTHPTPYKNSSLTATDAGCFYPPTDYTKWAALIKEWATHENARYPAVEATWQWEMWNEPDNDYWHGTPAQYDQLYDYTESALHSVLPKAPLGGPATSGVGPFLTQFLQHCATGKNAVTGATGTRLDLVSFHAKGGVGTSGGNVEMDLGHQLTIHNDGFRAVAGFPQFKQTPIVISEADPEGCGSCIEALPTYRTSTAYGAYEVAMMKGTLQLEAMTGVKVDGVLAWAFLVPDQPIFAAYRVLASNGIDLPVLNAFKLMGSLQGVTLPVTSTGALSVASILANGVRGQPDIDAMATRNGQQIQVLVWNYHDVLQTVAASPVSLTVQLPATFGTQAVVSHLRVDETHGDAYTVWVSQGRPATPSPAQLLALQQAMVPSPLQPDQTVAVKAGAVSLDFDLPRFGLSLITLSPVSELDASGGDADIAGSTDGSAATDATSTSTSEASSESASDGSSFATSEAAAADDASGATGPEGGAEGGAPGISTPASSSGCGCSVGPRELGSRPLLLLLAALALLRRRFRGRR